MFKGDFFNQKRIHSFIKVKANKTPSLKDLEALYHDTIMCECFEIIENDILGLIDYNK